MKMRKFLTTAAVVVSAVFVFAACGGGGDDPVDPYQNGGTGEGDGPAISQEGPAFATTPLMAPIGSRAEILAGIPDVTPAGSINVAAGTQATPNIWYSFDNVAVNAQARRLMFEGLGTITSNMDRELFDNPMVNREPIRVTDNADGSRTYTFTIYTDNQWSDGRYITAHDYVTYLLLQAHPYYLDLVVWPHGRAQFVGIDAWSTGEATTFTGVRLYGDDSFSVTVYADMLPHVWEVFEYRNLFPWPAHALIAGFDTQTQIVDEGNGAFFVGLTAEALVAGLNGIGYDPDGEAAGTGFRFAPTVASGPYVFHSYDPSSYMLTLVANPYFRGTWDGFVPRIERVIFSRHTAAVVVDALTLGEADMVAAQGQGATINAMFDALVNAGTHSFTNYPRNGQGFLRFHTDHGPTQFREVRQAIKWLIDREEFAEMFTQGHGIVSHAMYGMAHWFTQEAIARGMHDRMTIYNLNPTRAIEVLEAGGWVLNSQGQPFVLGVDDVRYKDISGLTQHAGVLPFADDPSVTGNLMRLDIQWATWNSEDNAITATFEVLVPQHMEAVGMALTTHRLANPLGYLSRATNPAPQFNLFNQGQTFNPYVWRPWYWVDSAHLGSNNMTWTNDPDLEAYVRPLRFHELDTEAGRDAFVEQLMDVFVRLNYEVLEIPLYVDIWYDFYPVWLGNWHNNSVWGFDYAVVRAYDGRVMSFD